jgi:hypothetical protein
MREDIRDAEPKRLAELMQVGRTGQRAWPPTDMSAIFTHLLATRLNQVVGASDAERGILPRGGEVSLNDITLGELLFQHPCPSLTLLTSVKDYAKVVDRSPEAPLPAEVGTVLYYLAVAAALAHHRAMITGADAASVRAGLTWALNQSWIGPTVRPVYERALVVLELNGGDADAQSRSRVTEDRDKR